MLIGKYDDVVVRIWLSLSDIEKWMLVAERKRAATITMGDVRRVRLALRACFEPEALS